MDKNRLMVEEAKKYFPNLGEYLFLGDLLDFINIRLKWSQREIWEKCIQLYETYKNTNQIKEDFNIHNFFLIFTMEVCFNKTWSDSNWINIDY